LTPANQPVLTDERCVRFPAVEAQIGDDILALLAADEEEPDDERRAIANLPAVELCDDGALVIELKLPFAAPDAAHDGIECYSACNFDPLSRGIGVQN